MNENVMRKKNVIKRERRGICMIIILMGAVLILIVGASFLGAIHRANNRMDTYREKAKCVETSFGTLSYIDEGDGPVVLSCHGICGGYDQAYDTLADKTDKYRVLAPSRFGYPGSDMPEDASVSNQAKAFVELLNQLGIEKTYVLATSAGGAVAIRFALDYPERTSGLILYCSGYPGMEEAEKEASYVGPPAAICNDFSMWFFSPLFGPIMGMDRSTIETIMPLADR